MNGCILLSRRRGWAAITTTLVHNNGNLNKFLHTLNGSILALRWERWIMEAPQTLGNIEIRNQIEVGFTCLSIFAMNTEVNLSTEIFVARACLARALGVLDRRTGTCSRFPKWFSEVFAFI
jgi:hypothetical protein